MVEMVVLAAHIELKYMGSYESLFFDNSNLQFWEIPNIIGVKKK